MLGVIVALFIVAQLVALAAVGILVYQSLRIHGEAAAFFGSAARFQDAIENRAYKLASRDTLGVDPAVSSEPVMAGQRMAMPEMPDVLRAKWKEATEGSNLPDAWQMPPQEV